MLQPYKLLLEASPNKGSKTVRLESLQLIALRPKCIDGGRGYGRAVVAASLLDARAQGVGKAVLFTGLENLPARRAYAALGFQPLADYRLVLLRQRA